jgi:hypothetical protein
MIKSTASTAAKSLEMMVTAYTDYKKTVEIETTKRVAISAWRDTRLAEISAQKDIIEKYLSARFTERSNTIQGFFHALDKGIATGNDQLINHSMTAILNIASQSPLAEAKEIMLAMHDPNVKSIEI